MRRRSTLLYKVNHIWYVQFSRQHCAHTNIGIVIKSHFYFSKHAHRLICSDYQLLNFELNYMTSWVTTIDHNDLRYTTRSIQRCTKPNQRRAVLILCLPNGSSACQKYINKMYGTHIYVNDLAQKTGYKIQSQVSSYS